MCIMCNDSLVIIVCNVMMMKMMIMRMDLSVDIAFSLDDYEHHHLGEEVVGKTAHAYHPGRGSDPHYSSVSDLRSCFVLLLSFFINFLAVWLIFRHPANLTTANWITMETENTGSDSRLSVCIKFFSDLMPHILDYLIINNKTERQRNLHLLPFVFH